MVVTAPAASVARLTTMSLVGTVISLKPLEASVSAGSTSRHVPLVTVIESGALLAPGFLNSAVMLLPPFWPMAFESR